MAKFEVGEQVFARTALGDVVRGTVHKLVGSREVLGRVDESVDLYQIRVFCSNNRRDYQYSFADWMCRTTTQEIVNAFKEAQNEGFR